MASAHAEAALQSQSIDIAYCMYFQIFVVLLKFASFELSFCFAVINNPRSEYERRESLSLTWSPVGFRSRCPPVRPARAASEPHCSNSVPITVSTQSRLAAIQIANGKTIFARHVVVHRKCCEDLKCLPVMLQTLPSTKKRRA